VGFHRPRAAGAAAAAVAGLSLLRAAMETPDPDSDGKGAAWCRSSLATWYPLFTAPEAPPKKTQHVGYIYFFVCFLVVCVFFYLFFFFFFSFVLFCFLCFCFLKFKMLGDLDVFLKIGANFVELFGPPGAPHKE
tara:strand:+ start:345 stop:746 length:402 start_codon:yes stop_codon:yes gene_type:complete